ncbi:hypothetical protein LDY10_13550 [Acinetobacter baumannii]|nr:hypothetical protein [Acinetobacter baumannii]MCA4164512.1 hypothetical protein [Acinetobacter baumannii]
MEVNKKVKGLTKNIISLCMDIIATGNDAFFSYQAHVGWLEVKVYRGSWNRTSDPIYSKDYIEVVISDDEHANHVIHKLKRTAEELTEILEGFLGKN